MNLYLQEVILLAQDGVKEAKDELVQMMIDNKCMRRVNRYLYRNRLLKRDDVEQEFWLGVVQAMATVRPEIGDPLQFLTWRGIMQIRNAMRTAIARGVSYQCRNCGYEGRYMKRTMDMECGRCGSVNLDSWEKHVDISKSRTSAPKSHMNEEMDIGDFKTMLTGRESEVLELMLDGFNKIETKYQQNYQRDIGEKLGITPQCVTQYLNRIKWKWGVFSKYL